MFYGMSSVKEYWRRACSNAQSDLETTSSDFSLDDSNSSSSKEYRDASCNVDFDCESDNLANENALEPTNKVTNNIHHLTTSRTDQINHVKPSRYIRWRVLMCLGIGLWAVLCIVDLLHSEKSFTRDWLYEFISGRKKVQKIEVPQKLEPPVLWYSNFGHNLWKIMTIMTSGGAYVLLFLLMLVFCADPRSKKSPSHRTSTSNNAPSRDSPHSVRNDVIVKKTCVSKNSSLHRFDHLAIPRILSVRLELVPSINLQRKFLSSIEKCIQADFRKVDDSPIIRAVCSNDSKAMRVFDSSVNRCGESSTRFSINRQMVELLNVKISGKLHLSSVNEIDCSIKKVEAVLRDSVSLCVLEARKSDLNFNASTFDLEIGEYLQKTNPPLQKGSFGNARRRNHESRRKSLNFEAGVSSCEKTLKTRMITSSPAFKKFLSNFKHNNDVS